MKYLAALLSWFIVPLQIIAQPTADSTQRIFQSINVFDLEYADDPQISPDGELIVYTRNFMDIMKDQQQSNLWMMRTDGSQHRSLTRGNHRDFSPRWSPDGQKLLFASNTDSGVQLYLRWMDTGETAKLTNLTQSPGNICWSPDGKWIALTMQVPEDSPSLVQMPKKPKGAEWADPAKYIDALQYRFDGAGYLETGYSHVFILSADGGTPRQLTFGENDYGSTLSWTPDSKFLILSSNLHLNGDLEQPLNTEVYELNITDGSIKALTDRNGPDGSPVVSPDGNHIAYVGFDDRYQGYQVTNLYVMNRDGSNISKLTESLDRDVSSPQWSSDSKQIYFTYDDQGDTKIGRVTLKGELKEVASQLGGTTLGRPYASGSFSLSTNGTIAYTSTDTQRPADVSSVTPAGQTTMLTHLNDDLLAYKELGEVEEIHFSSTADKRDIQGWIVYPPNFDDRKRYPLLLEIHGGPFANYGSRFSAEMQLYAANGYVVLYTNPRGSTSYGEEFGNLIHHNYPGEDYDDLISGVDAVIDRGFVDETRLFVTGGSGGGVLSSWIIGKTNRFAAAVVAKPVINWFSFVLTSDAYPFFSKYWFPGKPWEHAEHYMKRSPISLVGNVTTPTMLLTGESDYRTPISETEQYYQALKLQGVETAMVRIPGASHEIASRPSQLISKVLHIMAWFEKHPIHNTSANTTNGN
uniref:S9 family peptidase n=1 Tax=Roseihalotalea indica TaxID=2867963 RepID=A0AA49JDW6_9BACT|nr:S9 family peptidase [Tunicatimonas sp. TK19036]